MLTVDKQDRARRVASCRSYAAWILRDGSTVIQLSGNDRIDLLHRLTTNDMRALEPGRGRQTVLLTEKARMIDVVTLLQDKQEALLLGSQGTAADVLSWIRKYVIMDDVRLRDVTQQHAIIEIMGPRAAEVVESLLDTPVKDLAMSQWRSIDDGLLVVRMPSASELSYWLVGSVQTLQTIREQLVLHDDQIPELDSEIDEYVRVLAGMGRVGHEWTLAYNPLEAGLLHLTSFTKGCYIGQEVVARLDSYNKVKQRIMGLIAPSQVTPGDVIVADGNAVGVITSAVAGFDASQWFALGYVRGEFAHPGTSIGIEHSGLMITADLVLPPMIDPSCP
ncbi:MAG: YgfZ/GcvT domain-containing protein [Bacteroidota bacterium]|jgi:folate-binding protein YgfZ